MSVIHFGTSGWRAIIAEDFTFANVRLAAAGIEQYLLESTIAKVEADEYSLKGPQWTAPLRHDADPRPAYLEALRQKVNLKILGDSRVKIAYDPLFGTGRGYLDALLGEAGADFVTIHDHRDVLFSWAGPDPR